jgi:hypothetical protein
MANLENGDTQMKLTQLLTGAAAMALIAGAAQAQSIEFDIDIPGTSGDPGARIDTSGTFTTLPISATGNGYTLASELDFEDAAPTTNLEFAYNPQASIAGVAAARVTITLTGAVFDANIGDYAGPDLVNCDFDVVDGGGAGDTTVVFDTTASTVFSDCTTDEIQFSLPILLTGGDANFSVSVQRLSNLSTIDSDTFDADTDDDRFEPLIDVGSAFTLLALGDERDFFTSGAPALPANNTQIALATSFDTLVNEESGGNPANQIGNLYFLNSGAINLAGTGANFATAAQVSGVDVTIAVEDTTGLTGITVGTGGSAQTIEFEEGESSVTFEYAAGSVPGSGTTLPVFVELDDDEETVIVNQTPSASFEIDFTAASDLNDEAGAGVFDALDRQGTTEGPFRWTGDASAGTESIFRCVGFDGPELPNIFVAFDNSLVELESGEFPLSPEAELVGSELVIRASDLEDAAGEAFGRADVSFTFEENDITCNRFAIRGESGITDFGFDN